MVKISLLSPPGPAITALYLASFGQHRWCRPIRIPDGQLRAWCRCGATPEARGLTRTAAAGRHKPGCGGKRAAAATAAGSTLERRNLAAAPPAHSAGKARPGGRAMHRSAARASVRRNAGTHVVEPSLSSARATRSDFLALVSFSRGLICPASVRASMTRSFDTAPDTAPR